MLHLDHNLLSISGAGTEAGVLGCNVQGARERQLQLKTPQCYLFNQSATLAIKQCRQSTASKLMTAAGEVSESQRNA